MPLYRCLNCRREFELDKPACSHCGLDPAADPRDAQSLVELVVIHFDAPHRSVTGRGVGHAACDPKLKVGSGVVATGEKKAVNCRKCKASPAYLDPATPAPAPAETVRVGDLEAERQKAPAGGK